MILICQKILKEYLEVLDNFATFFQFLNAGNDHRDKQKCRLKNLYSSSVILLSKKHVYFQSFILNIMKLTLQVVISIINRVTKFSRRCNYKSAHGSALICGIDFSKSFSRCSHQQILQAYERLGASQWCLDMHAAFLRDRSMQVKIGNILSPKFQ